MADWTAVGLIEAAAVPSMFPRRILVPPDSCRGGAIGLRSAALVQLRTAREPFRVGATLPSLLETVTAVMTTEALRGVYIDTFVARVAESRRSRRLQQLFGPSGERLWFGDDLDVAGEALRRTVVGRTSVVDGGAWLSALTLERDGRAVIVGPVESIIAERGQLRTRGISVVPAGLTRLDTDGTLTLPAGPFVDLVARQVELRGFLAPAPRSSAAERIRSLAEFAWLWDQSHLDVLAAVAPSLEVRTLAPGQSVVERVDGML